MPARGEEEAKKIIKRKHPEFVANEIKWRWLVDSYEGGTTYRDAVYGTDAQGLPMRNLIRHKREDPTDGAFRGVESNSATVVWENMPDGMPRSLMTDTDPNKNALFNNYEMRRSRTPVPQLMGRTIRRHLSRIFSHDVTREAKTPETAWLMEWWEDVDGTGVPMDSWIRKTFAPLLFALGQLDVILDHPEAPAGLAVATQADEIALGIDAVILGYYLPENVLWWRLDQQREYRELLVREMREDESGIPVECFRHWEPDGSTLYDGRGVNLGHKPHPYGRPPVKRLFDSRQFRPRNVGASNYESTAHAQRANYNLASELVVMALYQSFPILQAPKEMFKDGTMSVGPDLVLQMQKLDTDYHGMEVVEFPTSGAESIRVDIQRNLDEADRDAALTKPAGATSGSTVSQSGISKGFDHQEGNDLLSERAETLAEAERAILKLAMLVRNNKPLGPNPLKGVQVNYPKEFDLYTADDLGSLIEMFQLIIGSVGDLPNVTKAMLTRYVRLVLPGMSEDQYKIMDVEIEEFLADRQEAIDAGREAEAMGAMEPPGSDPGEATDGGDGGEPADPEESNPNQSEDVKP